MGSNRWRWLALFRPVTSAAARFAYLGTRPVLVMLPPSVYKKAALPALRPFNRFSPPFPHRLTRTILLNNFRALNSPIHTQRATMSANIVLPDLPHWVQQRVTALYSAKTAEAFDSAFDAFIAKDVSIKVNGKDISRAQYKQMVQGEITGDVGAQVSFNGVVSVPADDKDLRAIGVSSCIVSVVSGS